MRFNDRYDAASKLIPLLDKYKNDQGVVFAVPRGGVPIGYYIAKHYNFPMELLLAKKIGHPWSEELAIGAVSLEDHIIDERHYIPDYYIENEVKRIRQSLKDRYSKFMGEDHRPVDIKKKTVIIVDDGIATGNTILASIKMLRNKNPSKIVVAVPVVPHDTVEKISKQVDDFICLHSPKDFYGVGQFYTDFSEVSDEEVIGLLKEANVFGAVA
jgi:putative phosphoribosyl transferase